MNKDKLNELLDSIYELEGLVHLALTRDDNPERLPELITEKGRQLANFAAEVSESVDEIEISSENLEDAGAESMEQVAHIVREEPTTVISESMTDFDAIIDEDMQSVVATVFGSLPETDSVASPVLSQEPAPASEAQPVIEEQPMIEPETVTPEPETVTPKVNVSKREPRGRLVFSINDRYRFKRELFGNSDAEFNNTLALVASMENYDEAEDYFLGEMQWDQKREEVIEFLETLKRYFKE